MILENMEYPAYGSATEYESLLNQSAPRLHLSPTGKLYLTLLRDDLRLFNPSYAYPPAVGFESFDEFRPHCLNGKNTFGN